MGLHRSVDEKKNLCFEKISFVKKILNGFQRRNHYEIFLNELEFIFSFFFTTKNSSIFSSQVIKTSSLFPLHQVEIHLTFPLR